MKNIPIYFFAIASVLLVFTKASAQQIPVRSNYLMTPFQDHVASAGNKPCLDMRMGFRNQWVGFEGAPSNSFASLSGRISETNQSIHGVGGRIETDEAGPWGTISFSFAYAYKLQMTNGGWLSSGLSVGLAQHRLNIGSLSFPDYEAAYDPAVTSSTQFLFPTIDAGVWYEDKHSFVGITMVNATAAVLSEMTSGTSTSRHLVTTVGSSIDLDGRFMFKPSAQTRMASGLPVSLDATALLSYDNQISIGVGYRNQTALVGHLQLALMDYITVGYAYDFGISEIRTAAAISHEVTIAISACDKRSKRAQNCSAYD